MRLFANDQNKIRCGNVFNRSRHGFVLVIAENVFCFYNTDAEMQTEIDTYISRGQASFNVHLLVSLKSTVLDF